MKRHFFVLLMPLVLVVACSKVTMENYDRLKVGMTFSEVKQMLGDPAKCDEVIGVRSCEWGEASRQIKINFVGDRLVLHSATGLK